MILISLAGIPPFVGFWGKWYVFSAAVQAGLFPLAIIGVVASVVGAYYYLRVIKVMLFDEPAEKFEAMPAELKVVLGLSSIFVIFYIVLPQPITTATALAAKSLF